jgi:hypothetical protein
VLGHRDTGFSGQTQGTASHQPPRLSHITSAGKLATDREAEPRRREAGLILAVEVPRRSLLIQQPLDARETPEVGAGREARIAQPGSTWPLAGRAKLSFSCDPLPCRRNIAGVERPRLPVLLPLASGPLDLLSIASSSDSSTESCIAEQTNTTASRGAATGRRSVPARLAGVDYYCATAPVHR